MAPGIPIRKKTATPRKAAPQTPKKTKIASRAKSAQKGQPVTPGGETEESEPEMDIEPEGGSKPVATKVRLYSKPNLNPGQLSSLYPWYYGPQKHPEDPRPEFRSNKATPHKSGTRKAADEDSVMVDAGDEGHDSDNTFADIEVALGDNSTLSGDSEEESPRLSRLPFGVKVEDLQNPLERAFFEKRMEQADFASLLVKGFDNEQLMFFLNQIKKGDLIAGYMDWNRINHVQAETRVVDGSEDRTREYFRDNPTDYPYNAYDGNETASAYAVMENIYLALSNARGDIKTYESVSSEDMGKLQWHRRLDHDIRAKHFIAATKEVEQTWKDARPIRYRDIATLRRAFDYLSNIFRPGFPWACSQAFFEATLEMLRVNKEYCMCVFDEDTDRFLKGFRSAMEDAEKRRMKDWVEARTDEQFFDLMGTGMSPDFEDKIRCAPNPYSSAS